MWSLLGEMSPEIKPGVVQYQCNILIECVRVIDQMVYVRVEKGLNNIH